MFYCFLFNHGLSAWTCTPIPNWSFFSANGIKFALSIHPNSLTIPINIQTKSGWPFEYIHLHSTYQNQFQLFIRHITFPYQFNVSLFTYIHTMSDEKGTHRIDKILTKFRVVIYIKCYRLNIVQVLLPLCSIIFELHKKRNFFPGDIWMLNKISAYHFDENLYTTTSIFIPFIT